MTTTPRQSAMTPSKASNARGFMAGPSLHRLELGQRIDCLPSTRLVTQRIDPTTKEEIVKSKTRGIQHQATSAPPGQASIAAMPRRPPTIGKKDSLRVRSDLSHATKRA